MSEIEFTAFREDVYSGRLLIGVDRHFARKFFMEASLEKVKERTGDKPYVRKGIILGLMVLGFLSVAAAIILGFFAFKWWGAIPLIICPIATFFYMSMSGYGRAGPYAISLLLVGAILLCVVPDIISPMAKAFTVLLIFGFWSFRLIYVLSTKFFRSFALRSQRHFDLLSPGLDVVAAEARQ